MKFALVHNWPDQKNSELELIKLIVRIAGDLGHKCSVIDPFGHPLSSDGEHLCSVEFLDLRQYDFCLNLHYVNPNFFDTFSEAHFSFYSCISRCFFDPYIGVLEEIRIF